MSMVEIQKEFFDSSGEKGKKRSPFFQSPGKQEQVSFSLDTLFLCILLLVMCVVVIYATGVEIGRQARSPLSKRTITIMRPVVKETPKETSKRMTGEAPPTAKTAKMQVKKFTIQAASYQEKNVAEGEAERLRKQGMDAFLIPSGKSIALCNGTYETRGAADLALAELQKRYKDCFIRNR